MSYPVEILVTRREFAPGKEKVYKDHHHFLIQCSVPSKYNLFINCVRQYGRCAKRIPMGWKFERIERFDDGSKRWVEYEVKITKGAEADPGFHLIKE